MKRNEYIVLFVSNAIPVAGFMFFGWSIGLIVLYYWLDALVLGFRRFFLIRKAAKGIKTDRVCYFSQRKTSEKRLAGTFISHHLIMLIGAGGFLFFLITHYLSIEVPYSYLTSADTLLAFTMTILAITVTHAPEFFSERRELERLGYGPAESLNRAGNENLEVFVLFIFVFVLAFYFERQNSSFGVLTAFVFVKIVVEVLLKNNVLRPGKQVLLLEDMKHVPL